MKTLLLLFFLYNTIQSSKPAVSAKNVYICNSVKIKKYHYKADCRALSNCQHRIVKMNLETAKKQGKVLCKWEK
jgi:hypothetical protein